MAWGKMMRTFHGWWAVVCLAVIALVWLPDIISYQQIKAAESRWKISNFLVVRSVEVGNAVIGSPVVMSVNRDILQPFTGSYSVMVRTFPERSLVCRASDNGIPYDPSNRLPKPLTLAWWAANGDCSIDDLAPGEYVIDTEWTLHPTDPRVGDQSTGVISSNPFTISLISPEEAEQVIQKQQEIESQVEGLTRGLEMLQHN